MPTTSGCLHCELKQYDIRLRNGIQQHEVPEYQQSVGILLGERRVDVIDSSNQDFAVVVVVVVVAACC